MFVLSLLACTDSADLEATDDGLDPRGEHADDPCHLSFSYALGETVLTGDFDSAGRTGTVEAWVEKGLLSGVFSEDGGAAGTLTGRVFETEDWGLTVEGYGLSDTGERLALYGFDQPDGAGGWFAFEEAQLDIEFEAGEMSGDIEGVFRNDGVAWGELADGRTFEGDWGSDEGAIWLSGDVLLDGESDAWLDGQGAATDTGWSATVGVYPLWCAP